MGGCDVAVAVSPGLSDPEEQRRCLDLGKEAGLDIPVITKSVVEQIRNIGVVGLVCVCVCHRCAVCL